MIAKRTKSISPKERTLVIVLLILVAAIFLIRELRGANSERSFLKASGSGSKYIKSNGNEKCTRMLDQFDEIFDKRRAARQKEAKTQRFKYNTTKTFYDLYEPEANCFSEERFGVYAKEFIATERSFEVDEFYQTVERYDAFGDGPKFACGVDVFSSKNKKDKDNTRCLVYSIGSNNEVGFELSVKKFLDCETHTFDPTIDHFVGTQLAEWHPWGVGLDGKEASAGNFKWKGKSFETIFKELGHLGKRINVLKIDCEGCEKQNMVPLFEMIADKKIFVDQIQIEMHVHNIKYNPNNAVEGIYKWFSAMDKARMRIVHKEWNHWASEKNPCIEYLFVSEDFLRTANEHAVC